MIRNETIQEITSKIDVVDIIGDFVNLKKRGSNYSGLCPFHHEKTPSFSVSKPKQIYKCFGCGKSGNAISFIMEHEKLSYIETMKWLAKRYNIVLEDEPVSADYIIHKQTADSLFILNQFVQESYSKQLFLNTASTNFGWEYLKERGFKEETLLTFQIGFAPPEFRLTELLIKEQFQKELIIKGGIGVEKNDQLYDNYKDRIVFPIHNLAGKIAGFGARILKQNANNNLPKYINTPETEIYNKSKLLYGLYFARQEIIKKDECILVEGYTDVLALHQAGIKNVVASSGTSLTLDQVLLIKKFTKNILIIYDGDSAGIKAASRGVKICLNEGLNSHLLLIPNNEDPDSFIKKNSVDDFVELLKQNKKDFVLFELEYKLQSTQEDVNKKNELVNEFAETIAQINKVEDFTKQEYYIKQCAMLLKINEIKFRELVNSFIKKNFTKEFNKNKKKDDLSFISDLKTNNQQSSDSNKEKGFLNEEEFSEQHFARVLLEYGLKKFINEGETVASHLLEVCNYGNEIIQKDYKKLIVSFAKMYADNLNPQASDFIYSEDLDISIAATKCLHYSQPAPLENWDKKDPFEKETNENLEYKNFVEEKNKDSFYLEDVLSVEFYFRLNRYKKIKNELEEKIKNLSWGEELNNLIKACQELDKLIKEEGKKGNIQA